METYIRKKIVDKRKIRYFESSFVIMYLIYIILLSNNIGVFAIIGTFVLSIAVIFKSELENLGITFIMMLFPPFSPADIVSIPDVYDNLIFKKLGFIRTSLYTSDGKIVMVPNSILFNNTIVIK